MQTLQLPTNLSLRNLIEHVCFIVNEECRFVQVSVGEEDNDFHYIVKVGDDISHQECLLLGSLIVVRELELVREWDDV